MVTFKDQLYAWRGVIFALFLRELQSKFNDKFGLSWAFFEPILFILILSILRGRLTGGDVHSIPIFIFMMVGLMGLQSFTKIFQGVSTSIKKNKPLYAFRQVQPITSAVTSGFLELIIKAIVGVLLALATYLLGMSFSLNDPLLFLFLCFNLGLLSFALGLIFAVGSAFVPETDKIKALMTRPLMFISCVFFSLQDIPQAYWHFFTWNPLVHFNELVRYSFFESYGDQGVSLSYLVKFTFLSLFLSLSMYHITWKKVLSR